MSTGVAISKILLSRLYTQVEAIRAHVDVIVDCDLQTWFLFISPEVSWH